MAPANSSRKRKATEPEPEPEPVDAPAKTTKRTKTTKAPAPPKKAAAAPKKTAKKPSPAPEKTVKKPSPAPKKPAPKKPSPPPKKLVTKTTSKRVLNSPSETKLHVYVMGDGSAGELGLGATKKATDVSRPRLNALLEAAGVVDIAVGGMHSIALTADNKILTWGVNDNSALGRDTKQHDAKTKDVDDAESGSDSEDDDPGLDLNPLEATPTAIPSASFPENTTFVQVAAGDSVSLALTDDGLVYGWGTFRDDKGIFGFSQIHGHEVVPEQARPVLVKGLKNIKQITCGENHALALDDKGAVWAWGCGKQDQLGRRLVGRHLENNLNPQPLNLPKKNQVESIAAGPNHSFAVLKDGSVYSWGLNSHMQTGIPYSAAKDDDIITGPTKVKALSDIKMISGGARHSIALNTTGELYSFGQLENSALGADWQQYEDDEKMVRRGGDLQKPKIVMQPIKVAIEDPCKFIASGPEHNIALTEEGRAYSWGFNTSYNCGQGETDGDVEMPTLIDNTAVRTQKLVWAGCGGQFSMVGSAF
ncbi:putative ran exchange factor prp20 pim1 [Venturia nashicola]|uniref:Putative ran exchange factor prp20 pim1 n=1 Tax=Venturia nashicola TaxID=86259 RepID=A0A4Z1PAE2_9PEZI|nr:putative ran exchange factor prp20 pim1 [Venturia nashicola]